jgi:hypothetical protein
MSFNYKSFIDEIIRLIEVANNFTTAEKKHDSESFKVWRHAVLDFIYQIERQKYSINCSLSTRQFHIYGYGSVSQNSQQQKFDKSLTDTINELSLIVKNYQKYGDPKNHFSPKEIENKELSWPDKVTLGWFIKHMPAGIWWGLICTLLAVLTAAYELGAYIQSHSISLP